MAIINVPVAIVSRYLLLAITFRDLLLAIALRNLTLAMASTDWPRAMAFMNVFWKCALGNCLGDQKACRCESDAEFLYRV
jgi:hypothetical protein